MSSSKSMLLRVVLFLEILLLVTADVTGDERRRFCGHHLTETLRFFCRSRYASPATTNNAKRSGDNEDYAYLSDEPLTDGSPFSYQSMPLLANFRSAKALRPRRVRRDFWYLQRGVADECCRKACTMEELKSYCF